MDAAAFNLFGLVSAVALHFPPLKLWWEYQKHSYVQVFAILNVIRKIKKYYENLKCIETYSQSEELIILPISKAVIYNIVTQKKLDIIYFDMRNIIYILMWA